MATAVVMLLGLAAAPATAGTEATGDLPTVTINEVESDGDVTDWVELANPGDEAVDLTGFVFRDGVDTNAYVLPAGTVLTPGAYLVLDQSEFGFGLGRNETARLFLPDGQTVVDSYFWVDHATTTYGRCPDGVGAFTTTTVPTRGAANDCPDPAEDVVLNEVESDAPDGAPGWVELLNTGSATVDLTGYGLTDGQVVDQLDATLTAGEYLVLTQGEDLTISLGAPGEVSLVAPAGGDVVDTFAWTAHAEVTFARCPDGVGPLVDSEAATRGAANQCRPDPAAGVAVNEVNVNGGPSDWIELINTGATSVDLTGYVIRDDNNTGTDAIRGPAELAPGAILVLEQDADFSFGLGNADTARLFAPDGATLIDSYAWTAAPLVTYGRCPDGVGTFQDTVSATKGAPNDCADPLAALVLNEVETDDPAGDWVELLNTAAEPLDASGLVLRASGADRSATVTDGTEVPAGGHLVLDQGQLALDLLAQDSLTLLSPSGTSIDGHAWDSHAQQTWGRCPDGAGPFVDTVAPTRGSANECVTPETSDAIRITEWMYGGGGGEFVELTNVGDAPVDLTGWSYDDDSREPGGFGLGGFGVVAAGESVVLTEDTVDVFRSDWGLCGAAKVIGPYTNNLGRADEINVYDAFGQLVDRLTYGDSSPAGGPRTQNASGWVSAAGLGANLATEWTLSTVGDAEGSYTSANGDVASPGTSTRAALPFDPCAGQVRITEFMYDGLGGELIELTNVGGRPVDVSGWSYDDDSREPGGFDLSGLGVIRAGESVVLTEADPAAFRADWGLCGGVRLAGPYTNNLGRADEINVFDADGGLVDRLTYGDNAPAGGPRTQRVSAWVPAAALGANTASGWTLSAVGDSEGSTVATSGDVGSPGRSTRATVAFDPCEDAAGGPTVAVGQGVVQGSVADPTNPTTTLTLGHPDQPAAELQVTVESSDDTVLPADAVEVSGDGAERTLAFAPIGRGTATVTVRVVDAEQRSATATFTYAASGAAADPSGRYHHGISDASAALDVGDDHMLLVNDETNTVFLHRQDVSGDPVRTWTFTAQQLGTSDEIDFEGLARSGDLVIMTGSHGNNRSGAVRPERRTFVGATITGSGADTELTFRGRYNGLREDLRTWDATDGHGLGADALGFVAGTAPGVEPNPPGGFNIEAAEFAPDGQTLYLGLRAPTVERDGTRRAVVVPLLNPDLLVDGVVTGQEARFGTPLLMDLGSRSIRSIASNDQGDYLVSAGPSPQNPTWALYTWDGRPGTDPVRNRSLPPEDLLTGGVWESIATVPHPLVEGAMTRLVTDSGDTDYYGTGLTSDAALPFTKSYSQLFTLGPVVAPEPTTTELFEELVRTVTGTGVGNSLTASATAAARAHELGRTGQACQRLQVLLRQVEATDSRRLLPADADAVRDAVARLSERLDC